jgi:hypothetical protein
VGFVGLDAGELRITVARSRCRHTRIAVAPQGRPTVRVKGFNSPLPFVSLVLNLLFLRPAADRALKGCAFRKEGRSDVLLPDKPDLDWLRKQAKRRLASLRKTNPTLNCLTRSSSWHASTASIAGVRSRPTSRRPRQSTRCCRPRCSRLREPRPP